MEDQVRNKRMSVEEFIRGAKERRRRNKIKKEENKKLEPLPSKGMSVEEFINKVRMKRSERKKNLKALELDEEYNKLFKRFEELSKL
jgi:hypothetical protein